MRKKKKKKEEKKCPSLFALQMRQLWQPCFHRDIGVDGTEDRDHKNSTLCAVSNYVWRQLVMPLALNQKIHGYYTGIGSLHMGLKRFHADPSDVRLSC
jgi:hypothetical protein